MFVVVLAARHHSDDEITDVNPIVLPNDGGLGDPPAVDVCAVGTVQIRDDEAPLPEENARMPFGNIAFRQHQIIALDSTQRDFRRPKRLATF